MRLNVRLRVRLARGAGATRRHEPVVRQEVRVALISQRSTSVNAGEQSTQESSQRNTPVTQKASQRSRFVDPRGRTRLSP
jgi:hypothetical protein